MMTYHHGPRFQRGRGIGSIFSGLIRAFRPLASKSFEIGKKFLTSDTAKNLGSTIGNMGKEAIKNVAVDILEGKNINESAKNQLSNARKTLAETLRGSGKKRKITTPKNKNTKKLKYDLLLD